MNFYLRLIEMNVTDSVSAKFFEGLKEAFSSIGVDMGNLYSWTNEPKGTVILVTIAEKATARIVGGIRVHYRKSNNLLPTEKIFKFDKLIIKEIQDSSHLNPCDLGGLWVNQRFRGNKLSSFALYGAIAASYLHGSKIMFASAHTRSAELLERLGMQIDWRRSLPWPDERFETFFAKMNVKERVERKDESAGIIREIINTFSKNEPFLFSVDEPENVALAKGRR